MIELLIVCIVIGGLVNWLVRGKKQDLSNEIVYSAQKIHHYHRAESLLTKAESLFYERLKTAVGPEAIIQCKVRLADVLLHDPRDIAGFRKVSQKHVDFLLCSSELKPLIAIELDDSTHRRKTREERDLFVDKAYERANLPLLHIAVKNDYDPAQIYNLVEKHLVLRGQ